MQLHGVHLAQAVRREVSDRGRLLEPGAVDECVEPTGLLERSCDERFDLIVVGDVRLPRFHRGFGRRKRPRRIAARPLSWLRRCPKRSDSSPH